MIKKLQIKFILLSMTALLLVLTIIIAGINIVNYNGVAEDADDVLAILSENKGSFPSIKNSGKKSNELLPNMSPEIPYESRYFSVSLNSDSYTVNQAETSRIISVDTSKAIKYAQTVISKNRDHGFVDDFRYMVQREDSVTRVIFLDCGRKLDSFRDFLLASVGISIAGYILVFTIIIFFSLIFL